MINPTGPTLSICTNDHPDCHAMQTLLFADDTALLMSSPNMIDVLYTTLLKMSLIMFRNGSFRTN